MIGGMFSQYKKILFLPQALHNRVFPSHIHLK
jgi:hypothetical protein